MMLALQCAAIALNMASSALCIAWWWRERQRSDYELEALRRLIERQRSKHD